VNATAGEPAQDADPPAARHTENAAEIINGLYCDRARTDALRISVAAPGSPEASLGAGSGSPSVCWMSYLGIPQPITATPLWSQRATPAWPESEVPVATRFEQDCCACSKTRRLALEAGSLR
jgi:hypothetical protein